VQDFWLFCKYLWTDLECGLILLKTEGSLSKMPGRRGIHGSRPLDHDLRDRVWWAIDLIWTAGPRSCGQGEKGAWGGGELGRASWPDWAASGRREKRPRQGLLDWAGLICLRVWAGLVWVFLFYFLCFSKSNTTPTIWIQMKFEFKLLRNQAR